MKINKNDISNGINILDVALHSKLATSKSEVRRMIKNNGLRINNEIVNNEAKIIYKNDNKKSFKVFGCIRFFGNTRSLREWARANER